MLLFQHQHQYARSAQQGIHNALLAINNVLNAKMDIFSMVLLVWNAIFLIASNVLQLQPAQSVPLITIF